MCEKISFALMSGGESKRFGSDKTLADLKGKPLYQHGLELGLASSNDVFLVAKDLSKYEPFIKGVNYITDDYPCQCPMAGMISVAKKASEESVFILSADSPLFELSAIKFMMNKIADYDAVIPVINGKYCNLSALYKKTALLKMEDFYKQNIYKIIDTYKNINVLFLNEGSFVSNNINLKSFLNINTPEDMKKAECLF